MSPARRTYSDVKRVRVRPTTVPSISRFPPPVKTNVGVRQDFSPAPPSAGGVGGLKVVRCTLPDGPALSALVVRRKSSAGCFFGVGFGVAEVVRMVLNLPLIILHVGFGPRRGCRVAAGKDKPRTSGPARRQTLQEEEEPQPVKATGLKCGRGDWI